MSFAFGIGMVGFSGLVTLALAVTAADGALAFCCVGGMWA